MQEVIELGQIYQEISGERRFGQATDVDAEGWVELTSPQGAFRAHQRHIQPSQWDVEIGLKMAIHRPTGTQVNFISIGPQQWKLEIPNEKLGLLSKKDKKSFGKEAYNAFLAEFILKAEEFGVH